jgi:nucleoside-diphosphate-sugar epimerase
MRGGVPEPELKMARYAVTGAFGFSGRHIAERLLAGGHDVVALTNHPPRPDIELDSTASPVSAGIAARRVFVAPLIFDRAALATSLAGVDTLFNTYWVRFARGGTTHAAAERNSATLFEAARGAGVRRIVHVSIANPDAASELPYYSGKARVEAALADSGMSHAILRPAVLFGDEPILANNVAWLLRRLPIFGIAGDGRYRLQPIHVDDLADLAVHLAGNRDNVVVDAAGPETLEYVEFVKLIRDAVGSRSRMVRGPSWLTLFAAGLLGRALGDVLLTRHELAALTSDLLVSHQPPLGTTSFTAWLADAAPWLGREYLSEVKRHFEATRGR